MKLIGSITESAIKRDLISLNDNEFLNARVSSFLKEKVNYFSSFYFFSWTPDQMTDFYVLLIDYDRVLRLEIDRMGEVLDFCIFDLTDFKRIIKNKEVNIRLLLAEDLFKRQKTSGGKPFS